MSSLSRWTSSEARTVSDGMHYYVILLHAFHAQLYTVTALSSRPPPTGCQTYPLKGQQTSHVYDRSEQRSRKSIASPESARTCVVCVRCEPRYIFNLHIAHLRYQWTVDICYVVLCKHRATSG